VAAVMKLWEEGSLDLDADVNIYLPFPVRNPRHSSEKITLRQILTHTSSIRDRGSVWGTLTNPTPYGYCVGDSPMRLGTFLENYLVSGGDLFVKDQNYYDEHPGSHYHYSNIAADTAAYVAEVASGQDYDSFVRENLLKPLGMHESGLRLADITT